MNGAEVLVPITFFVSFAAIFILRGPLGRAIAEAITHRGRGDLPERAAEEMHRLTSELEDMKQRLADLEERQDFAERLLTRDRETPQLGGP